MPRGSEISADLEQDDRFPSGPWNGFWTQRSTKGRQSLGLTFSAGAVTGDGTDFVGEFLCRGVYSTDAGTLHMTKTYSTHRLEYVGFAEGDGIWGTWTLRQAGREVDKGGFHLWPDAIGCGEGQNLAVEEPLPATR